MGQGRLAGHDPHERSTSDIHRNAVIDIPVFAGRTTFPFRVDGPSHRDEFPGKILEIGELFSFFVEKLILSDFIDSFPIGVRIHKIKKNAILQFMDAAETEFSFVRKLLPGYAREMELAADRAQQHAEQNKGRDVQRQPEIKIQADLTLGGRGVDDDGREQKHEKHRKKSLFHLKPPIKFGIYLFMR